jgi:hypothetical protein
MTVQEDHILILCESETIGNDAMSNLGVTFEQRMYMETKYYKSSVPVCFSSNPSDVTSETKAVIIIDSKSLLESIYHESLSEDAIRIFLTSTRDHIQTCLDRGFELVVKQRESEEDCEEDFGFERIKAALQCRMWSSSLSEKTSPVEDDEKIFRQFDDLMQRVHAIRESTTTLSDSDRKLRAAALATELAGLLGECDSNDSD